MQIQFDSVKLSTGKTGRRHHRHIEIKSICIVSSGGHKDGDIKTKVNHGLASKMLILWASRLPFRALAQLKFMRRLSKGGAPCHKDSQRLRIEQQTGLRFHFGACDA